MRPKRVVVTIGLLVGVLVAVGGCLNSELEDSLVPQELFLSIISVTSPVAPGENATLQAATLPGASCSIAVYYKSGPSTAAGLYTKTTDGHGNVSWTWKVGTRTTPGTWRIVVSAVLGGESMGVETAFTVQ